MAQQDPLSETKLDILKFIHQDQRGEIEYRREREYRVFTWSSTILSALIGALLITKQTDLVWKMYGLWGNAVASLAVLLIVFYTTRWLMRNERFRGQNAQVISRIDHLLHCFDKGYFTSDDTALFPASWGGWGARRAAVEGHGAGRDDRNQPGELCLRRRRASFKAAHCRHCRTRGTA